MVLVGDDRQFASIAAGGGFRALRLRLGASELTVNRRQVEAWEQQAIDDMRAGNLEQAIAAYAEHDRIRAFEARDDRDRALVEDWWQAHQQGEQPVIYAHRRAQVDQLNSVCQRLRAEAGQLGIRAAGGRRSDASRLGMWWCWVPTPATAWAWSTAPPPSSRSWTCPAGR